MIQFFTLGVGPGAARGAPEPAERRFSGGHGREGRSGRGREQHAVGLRGVRGEVAGGGHGWIAIPDSCVA
jgi:hypothetical protein